MFNSLKTDPQVQRPAIRDTLFGDMPFSQWLPTSTVAPASAPWASFGRAKTLIDSGRLKEAIAALESILETPNLESRHYLQSWHFLRELSVNSSQARAKDILGVVVEVGVKGGLDLVAAYSDHHARYYNFSGAGVVWEMPSNALDGPIDELLQTARALAQVIGPWKQARPAAPPAGQTRINLLTPSGLHFGQGPLDALGKDRLGGPTLASAFRLMQELIKLTKK